MLERRDIEVANQDGALGVWSQFRARGELVEERELVGEFRVDFGIRFVATGRHIEIVQGNRITIAGALAERHRNMACVGFAAEIPAIDRLEWQARNHGYAVIALLAVERDMLVAQPFEAPGGKFSIRTFGFLQTQHVRPYRLQESRNQIDAQPHRIDVPGRNCKRTLIGCSEDRDSRN
jgi:hypothetical protein